MINKVTCIVISLFFGYGIECLIYSLIYWRLSNNLSFWKMLKCKDLVRIRIKYKKINIITNKFIDKKILFFICNYIVWVIGGFIDEFQGAMKLRLIYYVIILTFVGYIIIRDNLSVGVFKAIIPMVFFFVEYRFEYLYSRFDVMVNYSKYCISHGLYCNYFIITALPQRIIIISLLLVCCKFYKIINANIKELSE